MLSRLLVRRLRWRLKGKLCSFCLFFKFSFLFLISPLFCSPGLVLWARDRWIVVVVHVVRAFRLVSAFWPCCCSFPFWCWSWSCARFALVLVLVLVLVLFCVFGLRSFPCICLASCAALFLRCMLVHVAVLAFAAR